MAKKIAVYGSYETKVPVKQRYWKTVTRRYWKTRKAYSYMKKGKLIKVPQGKQRYSKKIRQRVWKTTKRMKKAVMSGRYEFHGKGRDLYKAVVKAHQYMPKGFIDVSAEKFLEQPEAYGVEGEWIEREVES